MYDKLCVKCMLFQTKTSEKKVILHRFAIDKSFQGFGLGKKLLKSALENAEFDGYSEVEITTSTPMEGSRLQITL